MTAIENGVELPDLYATARTADFLSQVTGSPVAVEALPAGRELGEFVVPLLAKSVELIADTQRNNLKSLRTDLRVANLQLLGVSSLTQIGEVVGGVSENVNVGNAKTAQAKRHYGAAGQLVTALHTAYSPQSVQTMYERFLAGAPQPVPLSAEVAGMAAARAARLASAESPAALVQQSQRLSAYLERGLNSAAPAERRAVRQFLLAGPAFPGDSADLAAGLEQLTALVEAARTHVPAKTFSPTAQAALAFQPAKLALLKHVTATGTVETAETARPDDAAQLSGLGLLLERWPLAEEYVLRENLVQAVRRLVVPLTVDDPLAARIWQDEQSSVSLEQLVPTLKNARNSPWRT